MRLVGNFSNIVYHLSYELGLHWLFSTLMEKSQFQCMSMHWLKISCRGLQIDLPQIFVMWILILSWPWALFGSKFCIIFSISLLEKCKVFKRFSVVQWRLEGSSLLLLSKEHCFAKKELESSAFFLKSVTYSFPWKRGGMRAIFLLLKIPFNNVQ